jgi:predicted ArsR family transcriptional regulator
MTNMTTEERILTALRSGAMYCHHVGKVVGLDPFQARAWLETLEKDGLVVREMDGSYGLPHGGYTPPEAA